MLATHPGALTRVLGIVYRMLSVHVVTKVRLTRVTGATGAVTLIQRFGSALNFNIHLHMLALDGAYVLAPGGLAFRRAAPPCAAEPHALDQQLARRVGRSLERQGLLVRDAESDILDCGPEPTGAMDDLVGYSITYRVVVDPRTGQKVIALQAVPAQEAEPRAGVVRFAGFSLHAGLGVKSAQHGKLERQVRCVSRPVVAVGRLALTRRSRSAIG